ncbi:MAG: branched-chain amino acid transport system II carrier protein [Lachnospiraceae bacterium]|nr:branched-chain amino acid transport system II carrier protein [Lachnospiraceae bacterium]
MKKLRDILIIGFALFSTYFGAGNLMFPPVLGLKSGTNWLYSALGLAASGIMLPVIGIIIIAYAGGSVEKMTEPIHKNFYKNLMGLIFLSAVFITIPRTAAVAIELGIFGIFGPVPRIPLVIIFFALAFFVSMSKGKVIDRLGKVLTPTLVTILLIIVVKSLISPVGTPIVTGNLKPFTTSFIGGYQTGDLLVSFMMASIIIGSIVAKGYSTDKERTNITVRIGIVCFVCLFVIYSSLLFMGACGSSLFPQDIERAKLLVNLIEIASGKIGVIGLGIAVVLACFTTAVGELTSSSDFFEELVGEKISYRIWLLIFSIISVIVAAMGVDKIVELTAPFFEAVYPICTVILILGAFHKVIPNNGTYQGAVYLTTIYSVYTEVFVKAINIRFLANFVAGMPLFDYGFGWIIPAITGFILGTVLYKLKETKS